MSKYAVRATDIRVGYRGIPLIEEPRLTIPAGRITVLLGANGCGKSTLLKAMAGLHPLQDGRVWIGDDELATTPVRRLARRLAFLPQHPSAPEALTVAELVMMGRYPYRHPLLPPSAQDREAVTEALAQTDLRELGKRTLGTLSGGQRQRAWLAMVLAQQTDILMLDEPTSYLDLSHQYDLLNLIQRLNREHDKTLVLVLHDLNQAFEFADHLIYMKQGRIRAQGTPAQTASPELIEEIFGLNCDIQPHPKVSCPLLIPLAGQYGQ
ncbi:ABC transporter ATP-binding protein [Marinobacter salexigens]|uniref:ABC transporter ATP-binding protein n=1 Tax=Marinobacter salexigens TaxID=1925763 RepID=A0ABS6A860_9GAMM|nr:ABC transporter ATP-binding protein [Marinobacter salexigens]MBU2873019.1 ABC transporter ATP-binding protein [Marinobacter salexigens]